VEITETSIMGDPDRARSVLSSLHDLGVQIAIDDFGTGYSSLSYLERFPIDILKIDRTFVSTGTGASPIARAVIELGRTLELEVIAEGIEHADQARWLADLGCRYGQGYLFARPVGPAALEVLLAGGDGLGSAADAEPDPARRDDGDRDDPPRLRLVSGE